MTSTATAVPDIRRDRRYQVRQLGAATVGNIVEWYDWYIYAILASYFAGQFFPSSSDNPLLPLLSAMAIFAVGFLARPLGGLVIGMLADRFGRRSTLAWTIVGMGLGSLIIGLTPTYETIGVLAPVILVIARLLQGISTGGEFAAAAAFMVESAPPGRRGFFSSFSYISATTANLLAVGISTLLVTTLSADDMTAWGWRVPFLIGSVGALIGLWVRTHAEETHQVDETRAPAARVRMFDFLREHPKQALQLFLMVASSAVLFYVWTGYLPAYANIAVGFDVSKGLLISIASMSIFLVLQPLFGVLSDRIGRRPLLFAMSGFFIIFTVPLRFAEQLRLELLLRPGDRSVLHRDVDEHLPGRTVRALPGATAQLGYRLPLRTVRGDLRRHRPVPGDLPRR